jgi:hypothetical protein
MVESRAEAAAVLRIRFTIQNQRVAGMDRRTIDDGACGRRPWALRRRCQARADGVQEPMTLA